MADIAFLTFRTQLCHLWLRFEERAILGEVDVQVRKRKVKDMKNSVKKVLEADRNNVLVYAAYAQALLRVESYQVSRIFLPIFLRCSKLQDFE